MSSKSSKHSFDKSESLNGSISSVNSNSSSKSNEPPKE